MTDQEKFSEAVCTRDYLRFITGDTGRFVRPSDFDSVALLSFDRTQEAKAPMGELSYHHMIPLPEIVDLWSTLRAVYVDSCRAEEPITPHASLLRLALIALIQLSSVCQKGRDRLKVKPIGSGELSQAELRREASCMREDRFSDELASSYLEELDSEATTGKRTTSALKGLFGYLMWMDFNLIRGPSPSSRASDPGSNFDQFENSVRALRGSRKFSVSEDMEVRRLERRIQLVGKLYLAYSDYKKSAAQKTCPGKKQEISNQAIKKFCLAVLALKEWAKTSEGFALQVSPKEVRYTFAGGATTTRVEGHALSLTFTSYLERSLWVKRPVDQKWVKLKEAEDSIKSP
jgi:hypothetical protein